MAGDLADHVSHRHLSAVGSVLLAPVGRGGEGVAVHPDLVVGVGRDCRGGVDAAADATNDAAAGAHSRATISTLRAAAPTLALKVLDHGRPYSGRRGGVFGIFRKGSGWPSKGILDADMAKMLQRHADVREALSGVSSLSANAGRRNSVDGCLKNDADHTQRQATAPGDTSQSRGMSVVFRADEEIGRDLAAVDWTSTPLGPVEGWPQSLRTAVNILLSSRFAMWMAWGPELTFFCNAAYRRDTLGLKYPWALGRPASEVWAEIWADIGPRIERVLSTGEATWDEALMLMVERSGYSEESYHTFSYSPLRDDDPPWSACSAWSARTPSG